MRQSRPSPDWEAFVASAPRCTDCGAPAAHQEWRYNHATKRGITQPYCGFCLGAFVSKAIWDRLHCVRRTATRLWRRGEYDHLITRVGGGPVKAEPRGAGATAGAALRGRVPGASKDVEQTEVGHGGRVAVGRRRDARRGR